jgi:hypothetical protein
MKATREWVDFLQLDFSELYIIKLQIEVAHEHSKQGSVEMCSTSHYLTFKWVAPADSSMINLK